MLKLTRPSLWCSPPFLRTRASLSFHIFSSYHYGSLGHRHDTDKSGKLLPGPPHVRSSVISLSSLLIFAAPASLSE